MASLVVSIWPEPTKARSCRCRSRRGGNPAGKYDDGVDVCSLIGRGLKMMPRPAAPSPGRGRRRAGPIHIYYACNEKVIKTRVGGLGWGLGGVRRLYFV
jgi:hypothetical protein